MSDEICALLSIICSLSVGIYLYIRWFIIGKGRRYRIIEKAKKNGNCAKGYYAKEKIIWKNGREYLRTVTFEYTVGGKKYYKKVYYDYYVQPDYELPIYYTDKNPQKCVAGNSCREGEASCLVNILVTLFILFGLFRLLRFIF